MGNVWSNSDKIFERFFFEKYLEESLVKLLKEILWEFLKQSLKKISKLNLVFYNSGRNSYEIFWKYSRKEIPWRNMWINFWKIKKKPREDFWKSTSKEFWVGFLKKHRRISEEYWRKERSNGFWCGNF